MSRVMITAGPETNRWNEGQLIPETLISTVAQLVVSYVHAPLIAQSSRGRTCIER